VQITAPIHLINIFSSEPKSNSQNTLHLVRKLALSSKF